MIKIPAGIKRTINWSYERGSWQYDILCLLIILVIFLVPGRFFGDRDRVGLAVNGAPAGQIQQVEIEVEVLNDYLRRHERSDLVDFPVEALGFYLREQYNRSVRLLRYERALNVRQEASYRVWYE
jgi:hypothetical protein